MSGHSSGASGSGFAAQFELQNAGNHDYGLRSIPIFKHCEAESLRAVDEKSAARMFFILYDPLTPAIPADLKK
jgi:hypothetical protein